jgi:hypothetical protein
MCDRMKLSIRANEQLTADWSRYWINGIARPAYLYRDELYQVPGSYQEEISLLGYIAKEFARTKRQQTKIQKAIADCRFLLDLLNS